MKFKSNLTSFAQGKTVDTYAYQKGGLVYTQFAPKSIMQKPEEENADEEVTLNDIISDSSKINFPVESVTP